MTTTILHGLSHVGKITATGSLNSLHQLRKHLLYPEHHRHNVHGEDLKMSIRTVFNSPKPMHLFKVKSNAGIAGNGCADAEA